MVVITMLIMIMSLVIMMTIKEKLIFSTYQGLYESEAPQTLSAYWLHATDLLDRLQSTLVSRHRHQDCQMEASLQLSPSLQKQTNRY